jgi:oligopeptide/dipeptide ABC transporter ATP-binding protein
MSIGNTVRVAEAAPTPLLDVRDVSVTFTSERRRLTVVRSASVSVAPGQVVGLVGESGSGKTVTAMASIGLISRLGGEVTGGQIILDGRDVTHLSERAWSQLRGSLVGMVFQQPTRCLNPAFTVGEQIAEVVRRHRQASRQEAWTQAVDMLQRMHIIRADERANDYPHQLSGGMCQRVAIAMALVCQPKLLIADEPTTALDVTVQRKILDLLLELRETMGIGVLFITHDLGVIAEMCDEVAVMYAGEVVERGEVNALFSSPKHPYTAGLLGALPVAGGNVQVLRSIPGQVPSAANMPPGCRFAPRCTFVVQEDCCTHQIELERLDDRSWTRCVEIDHLDLRRVM